jgi:hypothetical protein
MKCKHGVHIESFQVSFRTLNVCSCTSCPRGQWNTLNDLALLGYTCGQTVLNGEREKFPLDSATGFARFGGGGM